MLTKNSRVIQLTVLHSLAWTLAGHDALASDTLKLEVHETAGIRRFGYPIDITLPELSLVTAETHFRLRDGDKVVPAQFRQVHTYAGFNTWWLDFNVSLMPNESRTFLLEYGPDVQADVEPRGLELKQLPDGFEIRNGSVLTWTLGQNLLELVKSVDAGGLRHVRSPGVRLGLEGPNGIGDAMRDVAVTSRVVRSGPLTIALRYEAEPKVGPLGGVKSTIDLMFPVSKSWVRVDWQIDDPQQTVESAHAQIAQNLDAPSDKEPTMVDFGAVSLVYMSLGPGTVGKLQAGQDSWKVLRGALDRLEPFVIQPSGADSGNVEGWAHIMDRNRCLALALGAFGKGSDDAIDVTATGDVRIARSFTTPRQTPTAHKSLRFWLHFVGFPPHLTAATSPQSMLSPLVVKVGKP